MPTRVKDQLEALKEGVIDLISEEELEKALEGSLKSKKPLRIKYGADPSAADLHLGHTVPLRKLKVFQSFGHKIVFIIGDFTARVGDPSQRSETRPMLTREQVLRNAKTYQEQVFQILDPEKTEVRYNSQWLDKLTPEDFLHLTAQYTVARLIERDDFKKRFESKQPISLVEFLYPLLQGYDSVVVRSDLEVGGSDQKFNLLVGRELQKTWQQKPQMVMTLPLIEGTDGVQKISKSYGNAVGIRDNPRDMFGKIMSIPDTLMERYYRYVSGLPGEEIQRTIAGLKKQAIHPREAKAQLAEAVVRSFHGAEEAQNARREFDQIFREKGVPDEIPTVSLKQNPVDLATLLKDSGLVTSKGEGRRLVVQGGVRVGDVRADDPAMPVDISRPVLVQCGKRKFVRVCYGA
ncbi:MAG: tyrosine--tRNA ligase [Omnitrophica bacterium GWA2_52_8]|nr:MAG: tyrosine--tRNA ligase [Omnitrophica bacterium GWA2_52_8]